LFERRLGRLFLLPPVFGTFSASQAFYGSKYAPTDMPVIYGTAEHWLGRAGEARAMAARMNDGEAKQAMLEIAAGYEKVAKRAEAREARVDMPNYHPNNQ
jgi:hypothetical protein